MVADLEQRLSGQQAEGRRVGVNPAGVQEQRRPDPVAAQEIDERLVVAAAARPAAGVEGQRDHPPRRRRVAQYPRRAEAPVIRGQIPVAGHDLGAGHHRSGWLGRASRRGEHHCAGHRHRSGRMAAGRGPRALATRQCARYQGSQHRAATRRHSPSLSRPQWLALLVLLRELYRDHTLARTTRGGLPESWPRSGPVVVPHEECNIARIVRQYFSLRALHSFTADRQAKEC